MARLVEDECDERAVAETLKIWPGADFVYSSAINHTRPRPACGGALKSNSPCRRPLQIAVTVVAPCL